DGGLGDDQIEGGIGIDVASYAGSTGAIFASLAAERGYGMGIDRLYLVEALIGSAHADELVGDSGDNKLEGGKGDDLLNGALGSDRLVGGEGGDMIVAFDGYSGNDLMNAGAGSNECKGDPGDTQKGCGLLFGSAGDDCAALQASPPMPPVPARGYYEAEFCDL